MLLLLWPPRGVWELQMEVDCVTFFYTDESGVTNLGKAHVEDADAWGDLKDPHHHSTSRTLRGDARA